MGVDCLAEVTATFFKSGDKIYYDLEDVLTLTSFGQFLDDKGTDYWDLVEKKENKEPEESEESCGEMFCRNNEHEEHYIVLKDFIGFSFYIISFGDCSNGRGIDGFFADQDLPEYLEGYEDDLVKWATEEKKELESPLKQAEIDRVKFVLALALTSVEVGNYDCREWESQVDILGKLDITKIKDILT